MDKERTVVIISHGKTGENMAGEKVLTLEGIRQIETALFDISQLLRLQFQKIFYSGHACTLQCATVAQTYLGLPCVEKDLRFDYE